MEARVPMPFAMLGGIHPGSKEERAAAILSRPERRTNLSNGQIHLAIGIFGNYLIRRCTKMHEGDFPSKKRNSRRELYPIGLLRHMSNRRRTMMRALFVSILSLSIVVIGACTKAEMGPKALANLDATPPPDFHADVDPWPPPGPVESEVLLEASRNHIGSRLRNGHLRDRKHPELFAREGNVGGYDYLEVIFGPCQDPDAKLPLIVLLHGRGDRPRVPGLPLSNLPTPVRVWMPRAPDRLGDGFTWLATYTRSGQERLLARSVSATAAHLAAAIEAFVRERQTLGKPIVVGFSQGAILTYALTTRYPHLFAAGFPVAGFLPVGVEPAASGPFPVLHALHGDADPTVPIEHDRRSVELLRSKGHAISFSTAHGVGHTVSGAMELTVRRWIRGTLFPNDFPDDARAVRSAVELAAPE